MVFAFLLSLALNQANASLNDCAIDSKNASQYGFPDSFSVCWENPKNRSCSPGIMGVVEDPNSYRWLGEQPLISKVLLVPSIVPPTMRVYMRGGRFTVRLSSYLDGKEASRYLKIANTMIREVLTKRLDFVQSRTRDRRAYRLVTKNWHFVDFTVASEGEALASVDENEWQGSPSWELNQQRLEAAGEQARKGTFEEKEMEEVEIMSYEIAQAWQKIRTPITSGDQLEGMLPGLTRVLTAAAPLLLATNSVISVSNDFQTILIEPAESGGFIITLGDLGDESTSGEIEDSPDLNPEGDHIEAPANDPPDDEEPASQGLDVPLRQGSAYVSQPD